MTQPDEPMAETPENAGPAAASPDAKAETENLAGEAVLKVELAKAKEDILRALAEVENTRRRAERQVQDARAYAIDRFARDLLPVADTLARALAAAPAREAVDDSVRTLLDGIQMTERAMIDALARHGLKQVGAKGEPFDPNLHQAVAQAPSEVPAGAIAEVMQAGYTLGDRTLRAAMVLVSTGPAAQAPPPPSNEGGAEPAHIDIKV